MKWLLVLMICLVAFKASAHQLTTSIYEIEIQGDEDVMVKTDSGDVFWVSPQSKFMLQRLTKAQFQKVQIELEIDKDSFIISAKILDKKSNFQKHSFETHSMKFEPTVFSSFQSLNKSFLTMRRDSRRRSQCYERAYVWAYDLWNSQEIHSMKIFLFFTSKYIREYRFKWWFHVTPMSYLGEEEYVLDRLFAKGPLRMKTWTNIFMRNNAVCKSVVSYFDYDKEDPNESCFLIRSSMYYLGPNALKRRDQGYELTKWNTATLRTSRRRGFR
jgi:cellobiose-specific phosphotransferase system component IIB